MALNIKNPATEAAVKELALITGESQTEAVLIAVLERAERLRSDDRHEQIRRRLRRAQEIYKGSGISLDEDLYDYRGLPR